MVEPLGVPESMAVLVTELDSTENVTTTPVAPTTAAPDDYIIYDVTNHDKSVPWRGIGLRVPGSTAGGTVYLHLLRNPEGYWVPYDFAAGSGIGGVAQKEMVQFDQIKVISGSAVLTGMYALLGSPA